jgi:hypothetical protein
MDIVRSLREWIIGLIWGWELDRRNKNIASRSAKVSTRENDNFLFSSQQKERFLKNCFYYRLVIRQKQRIGYHSKLSGGLHEAHI